MAREFTLYWSSLDKFEKCPQNFLWSKGWGVIDVGGGPGKKKPKPYEKSMHHAIMGIVIQAAIERFYNDELWKLLTKDQLRERLLDLCEQNLKLELARHYIDWRQSDTREEMDEIIKAGVMGYMRTLKHQRLLGPYSKAELDMVAYVNQYTPIGGRADLILRRDDGDILPGITIIDGKNSRRYKDTKSPTGWKTYTDPDQLRWYALCFYLCYNEMPDHLGFVYYRYPYGATVLDMDGKPVLDDDGNETKETGVDWVEYTKEDLKGLGQRAVDARKAMDKEKFDANPNPQGCRFCDFESVCPERQAQKDKNRRRPRNTDDMLDGVQGFQLLNMGGSTSEEKG